MTVIEQCKGAHNKGKWHKLVLRSYINSIKHCDKVLFKLNEKETCGRKNC